jgi:hypothetical protein
LKSNADLTAQNGNLKIASSPMVDVAVDPVKSAYGVNFKKGHAGRAALIRCGE